VLEIKNNMYQPVGLILNDGTQMNIPKREKRYIKKDLACYNQINCLLKQEKIKVKEINK